MPLEFYPNDPHKDSKKWPFEIAQLTDVSQSFTSNLLFKMFVETILFKQCCLKNSIILNKQFVVVLRILHICIILYCINL